ncbi:hypothetical protein Ciccas_005346, partial [Cichlidogyrus casuarinus]
APWCRRCKSFAHEYEKAAKILVDEGSAIKLGKVDATVHSDLATRYKVQGYPTLKFFKKGSEIEYNGPRKAEGIIGWLKKKIGPALHPAKDSAELQKMKEDNKIVAFFYSKDENHKSHKAVTEVATKVDDITFVHINDASLAKEQGISGDQKLVIFRKFDDPKVEYSGAWEEDAIKNFVKIESVPLVTEFSQETALVVFESQIKIHIIFFASKKSSDYQKNMEMMKAVAIPLKGKCHAIIVDMDDEESARVGEFFGVTASDVPTFRVINLKENVKYQPEKKEFTADYIIKFTNDVLDGKVKPHLKSADEPADWDKEPVKVLVAKTFKERAVSKDKSVFIEFYAPWCGHCKALAPIWDELGAHYKDNADVIIAKCDATENEVEEFNVSSYPTLKFSPKGSTEFVDYSGARDEENFIKFIDSNYEIAKKKTEDEKHDEL